MSAEHPPPTRTPSRKLRRPFAAAVGLGALVLVTTAVSMVPASAGPDDQLVGSSKGQDGKVQVVHVDAPSPEARTKVSKLGLDMTEHGDASGVEVVLHGTKDRARLREAGFDYNVKIADLAARERTNAAKDRKYAAKVAQSPLPSGRTSYRNLS